MSRMTERRKGSPRVIACLRDLLNEFGGLVGPSKLRVRGRFGSQAGVTSLELRDEVSATSALLGHRNTRHVSEMLDLRGTRSNHGDSAYATRPVLTYEVIDSINWLFLLLLEISEDAESKRLRLSPCLCP